MQLAEYYLKKAHKLDVKYNSVGSLESGAAAGFVGSRSAASARRPRTVIGSRASAPTNAKITRAPSVLVIVILVPLDPT